MKAYSAAAYAAMGSGETAFKTTARLGGISICFEPLEIAPGPLRVLVKDGVWQVPVWERPRDWRKYGAAE